MFLGHLSFFYPEVKGPRPDQTVVIRKHEEEEGRSRGDWGSFRII